METVQKISMKVPREMGGQRADVVLARLSGLSRSLVASLIEEGKARSGSGFLTKSQPMRSGDTFEIEWEQRQLLPQKARVLNLKLLYADEDIAVVDKPAGLAAHPSPGWSGDTVLGGLTGMEQNPAPFGPADRQGIVHRLDANTTGVMVVAKSLLAYTRLREDFRYRRVKKEYLTLVQGYPDPSLGSIDAPIGRSPKKLGNFAVVAQGKPSVTYYALEQVFPGTSLMRIRLETGRTHQIRVHFSYLRHPLVGDLRYGADPVLAKRLGIGRQWLHASSLAFAHPLSQKVLSFSSELPEDLAQSLKLLESGY